MAAQGSGKFVKLKIACYDKRTRINGTEKKSIDVMFNPQSFSQTFANNYAAAQGYKNTAQTTNFISVGSGDLSLSLLFDGTGVTEPAARSSAARSVPQQVKEFLDVAYVVKGQIHEPSYLRIIWGILDFPCRLADATVTYTLFDRDGIPLRAEISARFLADQDPDKTEAEQRKSSPDLTHIRLAKSGDSLPQLTAEIYQTTAHYVEVARFNKLNNLRRLDAGKTLRFPPLKR
jgi:hypothetical protein